MTTPSQPLRGLSPRNQARLAQTPCPDCGEAEVLSIQVTPGDLPSLLCQSCGWHMGAMIMGG